MSVFKPFSPLGKTDNYQLNLPHWRQEGCTYFLTWRLEDAIPKEQVEKWKVERRAWMEMRDLPEGSRPDMLSAPLRREYHQKFTLRMERWMDAGRGECVLRQPECGRLVVDALRHFDGKRYILDDFVVMPNHAHVLVMPLSGWKLEEIGHSWKSFTAHRINEVLDRTGTLWLDETWDHIVRSWAQLEKFRHYIHANPSQARLKLEEHIVGRGSGVRRE
jgi:putative transposase